MSNSTPQFKGMMIFQPGNVRAGASTIGNVALKSGGTDLMWTNNLGATIYVYKMQLVASPTAPVLKFAANVYQATAGDPDHEINFLGAIPDVTSPDGSQPTFEQMFDYPFPYEVKPGQKLCLIGYSAGADVAISMYIWFTVGAPSPS
jgi:hypothetical protein